MLEKLPLEKVLFLDIETVPQVSNFAAWDEHTQHLFLSKNRTKWAQIANEKNLNETPVEEINEELFRQIGGIQAEFGKIICISCGFIQETRTGKQVRIKSFYHDDEETLLKLFSSMLNEHYASPYHVLCGHNAKEFDFPYICRRMLINGLKLPPILDIAGKKPWEINHIDTLELWKFGDYKAYTSLALLCHVFGVPTPKDDISGADVARVYYENDKANFASGLERIKTYCEKDVLALVQLFLRMKGNALLHESDVHYV
jgi:hypothetical protein